ncbi:class E sortase [Streptomyces sp. NPDC012623]|uniref:class E sortase n=1 Tax=unclassified Streptomyces TaxID=2593676 RepID=UPI00369544CE
MTALRPEHDAGHGAPYGQGAYDDDSAFESAVDGLADPLNDPLPGQHPRERPPLEQPMPPRRPGRHRGPRQDAPPGVPQGPPAHSVPPAHSAPAAGHAAPPAQPLPPAGPMPPARPMPAGGAALPVPPAQPGRPGEHYARYEADAEATRTFPPPAAASGPRTAPPPPSPAPAQGPGSGPGPQDGWSGGPSARGAGETAPLPVVELPDQGGPAAPEAGTPAPGGRAERRKAAKGGGRGRRRTDGPPPGERAGSAAGTGERAGAAAGTGAAAGGEPGASAMSAARISRPLSRMEARRAARALKESPAVIISRAVGELFITFGVLMLLFVTYQLWWTNVRADLYAGKETSKIQDSFSKGRKPGAFEPGQGFAIMHIPKLDVVVPIAEGISKAKVLDHGMVGHYAEGTLKTAMPADKQGNFAVAGHRNTHGEPFRYINQLKPGDKIIVETQDAYYTYDMASILPQTPPSNVSVIQPVPQGSGFTKPGRYITLTTCTPEFTSTYRMIVWGKMVDERPRAEGKPDALVR